MYAHLNKSKNILISGCGGGYDVFCGLDLMFNLIDQGKNVVLGNYTFTKSDLLTTVGSRVTDYCYRVDCKSEFDEEKYIDDVVKSVDKLPSSFFNYVKCSKEQYIQSIINSNSNQRVCYFPEYRLVNALVNYGLVLSIYCFMESGIKQLTESYNKVIELHNIDTIILVDGGTDSLMTGDERDGHGDPALGTPFEDISSIVAVSNSTVKTKFLYCLGYNVDRYHGVIDEKFLCNTSNMIREGHFIGSYMLNKRNEFTQMYIDVFMKCNPECSIVNSQIISAIQGHYGNYCPEWLKDRLANTVQKIDPLLALYWIYELDGIYKHLKYDVDKLKNTTDESEISELLKL